MSKAMLLFDKQNDVVCSKSYDEVFYIKIDNVTGSLILHYDRDKEVLNLNDYEKIIIDNREKIER